VDFDVLAIRNNLKELYDDGATTISEAPILHVAIRCTTLSPLESVLSFSATCCGIRRTLRRQSLRVTGRLPFGHAGLRSFIGRHLLQQHRMHLQAQHH
jgi:hypothetical protein